MRPSSSQASRCRRSGPMVSQSHPTDRREGSRAVVSARRSGVRTKRVRERKSVVEGQSVSVRVVLGGRRVVKTKNNSHRRTNIVKLHNKRTHNNNAQHNNN